MTELSIIKNDSKDITVTVTNDAGSAVDITGYTVFFTAKTNPTDTDANALISKTVTSHTDPTNGITTISLATSDTAITPGKYWYDFQIKDTSGFITSTTPDNLIIVQDITTRTS